MILIEVLRISFSLLSLIRIYFCFYFFLLDSRFGSVRYLIVECCWFFYYGVDVMN